MGRITAMAAMVALSVVPAGASAVSASAAGEAAPAIVAIADPAWSPTRPEIAFVATLADGSRDVFVAAPDGSRLRRLEQRDADKRGVAPRWSPDGNRLALTGFDGRTSFVVVVDRNGSEPGKFIAFGEGGSWARDSRRLAFDAQDPTASPTGVAVADVRTGKVRGIALDGRGPTWSPHRDVIAYSVIRCTRPCRASDTWSVVYVVGARGENRRRIFRGENAAWSYDGRLLAVTAPGGIYVGRRDGPNRRLVFRARIAAAYEPMRPTWAPHRQLLLAVVARGRSAGSGAFIVDVARNRFHRLLGPAAAKAAAGATWSPDGRRLAFALGSRLYVVGADSKGGHFVVPHS